MNIKIKELANRAFEKTEKDGLEHGYIININNENEPLKEIESTEKGIKFSSIIYDDKKENTFIVIHTHPTDDSPLSEDDLNCFLRNKNIFEMVAVTRAHLYKIWKCEFTLVPKININGHIKRRVQKIMRDYNLYFDEDLARITVMNEYTWKYFFTHKKEKR